MSYTAGEIKVNHAGMSTCVNRLNYDATELARIRGEACTDIAALMSAWQGSSGDAFKDVGGTYLHLHDFIKDELLGISRDLALTDQAFAETDAALSSSMNGVG
jgi:uncharacterized protein YukE